MGEQILIVEDDAVVIKGLEMKFRNGGYKVVAATSAGDAIRATVTQRPDLMILDLTLLDGLSVNGLHDGLSMLHWLRRTLPEANFPVIVHTADSSFELDDKIRQFGVTGVFRKGNSTNELMAAVRKALDDRAAKKAA